MARHKYTLMMKDECGHWTLMPHGSSVNSKKEMGEDKYNQEFECSSQE